MRVLSLLTLFTATIVFTVQASSLHIASLSARHVQLATRSEKRCPNRSRKSPTSSHANSGGHHRNHPPPSYGDGGGTSAAGLLNVKSSCGPIGATHKITSTSGPNGNIDWLNCGINDGGWRPSHVAISDLITVDLSEAVKSPSSPFSACKPFISLFERHGGENGIPPIMLASFAMQESSCKPNTVGGAGEQGLMQLTKDKCGGAPGGNCKEPNFNIGTAARFYKQTLKDSGGNVLVAIGKYNGWFPGMTFGEATAAGDTQCCRCQKNLDYLHQFVNGWCQNVDSYSSSHPLGKYWNLKKCGDY